MSLAQFQFRRGTAAQWTSANPVLASGEVGLETDTEQFKIGNGATAWNARAYGGLVGPSGRAITSIVRTAGDGSPGTTDTYTINYSVAPLTSTFTVYNGANGLAYTADAASLELIGTQFRQKDAGTTNAKLASMPANAVKLNATAGAAAPTDFALAAGTTLVRKSTGNIIAAAITDYVIDTLHAVADATGLTALLDLATTSLKGLLSPIDKVRLINLQFDVVADFGFVGNDSTDNKAAWDAMIAALPVGASVYFPPGTYRTSGEFTISVDKRITFFGKNRYASIIKTTSATANIFNISAVAWRNTWIDLGFQSSVNKTAGACIAITLGQAATFPTNTACSNNVYRCWFDGTGGGTIFHGINYTGWQAGNLAVLADLDMSAFSNGGRGIVINGSTINIMIHNATINLGAATSSACCEINASGAVQVTGCDWIMGTNVLLMNAASALGAQACYFTNCFFDQPQGDVILINGGFSTNRVKFTQCGIAPTGNNHGVHINGTGAGAAGTATALPAGISVVDCDIYAQSGSSTGAGIRVNGCQDINVQNCRVTGFSGAGGAAVKVTPSAANVTRIRVNGNIFGPNSNLTLTNTIGVQIEAGASAPAALSITDNTMTGCTTAILDASTPLATVQDNFSQNQGDIVGFTARATYGATILTTADTVVMSLPIPANALKVGTTFHIRYHDTQSATTVTNVRVRIGPAGTTADAAVVLFANATAVAGTSVDALVTITAIGASATFHSCGTIQSAALSSSSNGTALSPAFNSAVANFLTLSIASGSTNTRTVRGGIITCVM